MANEKFIQGKHDNGHHDGQRSTLRRLQSAIEQIKVWRGERTEAHLVGHTPDLLNTIPQDQEIVLFPQAGEPIDRGEWDSQGNRS